MTDSEREEIEKCRKEISELYEKLQKHPDDGNIMTVLFGVSMRYRELKAKEKREGLYIPI